MEHTLARRSAVAALLAGAMVTATASPGRAHPVDGTLPGGTDIQVSIDAPADGATLPAGPVTVTGTASVASEPVALIYVLDVSASATNPARPGCGGDPNGDGGTDQVLDCEITAATALNDLAVDSAAVSEAGVVVFADGAAAADVAPTTGEQSFTGPATDGDADGTRDLEQVFRSAFNDFRAGGTEAGVTEFTPSTIAPRRTDFAAALTATTTVAGATSAPRTVVAFISDGFAAGGGSIDGPLDDVPEDVDIFTFAVGSDSDCLATGQNDEGSLDQITKATVSPDAECVQVDDASELPGQLPGVIASELSTLTLSVDGGPETTITDVTPSLPQEGPTSVDYSVTTGALLPGNHEVCVTAAGSDIGGTGGVTDCHTITIHASPEAFAVEAQGVVTIAKTPHATCPPDESLTTAALNAGIVTVDALNAACAVDTSAGETAASASVDEASLLGGAITVSNVGSDCDAGPDGISGSSSIGHINGIPIGTGSGSLVIPLVAEVHYNETTTDAGGRLMQNAIRVETLLGQQLILAGCRVG